MIDTEECFSKGKLILLALLLLPLYLWLLTFPLTGSRIAEAALAVQQADMDIFRTVPELLAGLDLQRYPLKIYAATTLIPGSGLIPTLALRLPALAALAGLAAGSGILAGRLFGRVSLPAAAALVTAMPLSVYSGLNVPGNILLALFLAGAWLIVFYYGFQRDQWLKAWIFALLAVFFAAFEAGLLAYVYFYLPLLFLRRPLHVWKYLGKPAHLLPLLLTIGLFALWFTESAPENFHLLEMAGNGFMAGSYLLRLAVFPFAFLLILMPWPLLAWPTYCVAFQPLEKQPAAMQYLRTIVTSIFIVAWLVPAFAISDLFILVPPLAVLSAAHYEILMRRYRNSYIFYNRIMFFLVTAGALFLYLVYFLDVVNLLTIEAELTPDKPAIFLPPLIILAGYFLFSRGSKLAVWLQLTAVALLFLACYLSFNSLLTQHRALNHENKAGQLAESVPADETVYVLSSLAGCEYLYYLNRPLKIIETPDELPDDVETVYLLGKAKPPIAESRQWEHLSDAVKVPEICTWDLQSPGRERRPWLALDVPGPGEDENGDTPPVIARMFTGVLQE